MPAEYTYKIRNLNADEINCITKEITKIDSDHWIKHFKIPHKLLSLNDGESIHINWPVMNQALAMPEKPNLVPKLLNIINTVLQNSQLGRAYIHRLKPGDCIEKHHDQIHVKSMNIKNRYHIYLSIPNGAILMFDGQIVIDKKSFEFSLVNFALEKVHYYRNNSEENWYFVVFDEVE